MLQASAIRPPCGARLHRALHRAADAGWLPANPGTDFCGPAEFGLQQPDCGRTRRAAPDEPGVGVRRRPVPDPGGPCHRPGRARLPDASTTRCPPMSGTRLRGCATASSPGGQPSSGTVSTRWARVRQLARGWQRASATSSFSALRCPGSSHGGAANRPLQQLLLTNLAIPNPLVPNQAHPSRTSRFAVPGLPAAPAR